MIRAASWFSDENYGQFLPNGPSWKKPSTAQSAAEIVATLARPVKYFGRMTRETRSCLCAATIALRAIDAGDGQEIGLIAAGADGCLEANQNYFQDYVASGRSIGRGNLFIYTLPTSASGEVAIALSLCGPCLFVQDESQPLQSMLRHSEHLLADGEADLMFGIWSDCRASICIAVDVSPAHSKMADLFTAPTTDPSALIRHLQTRIGQP